MKKREKTENIQNFIVDNISSHRSDIARLTAEHFQISRAAVARHIALLVNRKIIRTTGNTKARLYALVPSIEERFGLSTIGLEEDVVWREKVSPLLVDIPENVRTICNYGFTEMLNNAIDHSESEPVHVSVLVDSANIYLWIRDFGIGVFKKLMRDLHLHDARHALFGHRGDQFAFAVNARRSVVRRGDTQYYAHEMSADCRRMKRWSCTARRAPASAIVAPGAKSVSCAEARPA